MSVQNVKVEHLRPKYDNLKHWMADSQTNYYIGRAGVVFIKNALNGKNERFPKKNSIFCNPFKVGKDGNREEVVAKYELFLRDKLKKDNGELMVELMKLKGKNLGCWCYPEVCHGNVLVKLIAEFAGSENNELKSSPSKRRTKDGAQIGEAVKKIKIKEGGKAVKKRKKN